MRLLSGQTAWSTLIFALLSLTTLSSAEKVIESDSLTSCAKNPRENGFTPSLFQVAFTPANRTLGFRILGFSAIAGNVTAEIDVSAYGYEALNEKLDPCTDKAMKGLCPMTSGQIDIKSNIQLSKDAVSAIPGMFIYVSPCLEMLN